MSGPPLGFVETRRRASEPRTTNSLEPEPEPEPEPESEPEPEFEPEPEPPVSVSFFC